MCVTMELFARTCSAVAENRRWAKCRSSAKAPQKSRRAKCRRWWSPISQCLCICWVKNQLQVFLAVQLANHPAFLDGCKKQRQVLLHSHQITENCVDHSSSSQCGIWLNVRFYVFLSFFPIKTVSRDLCHRFSSQRSGSALWSNVRLISSSWCKKKHGALLSPGLQLTDCPVERSCMASIPIISFSRRSLQKYEKFQTFRALQSSTFATKIEEKFLRSFLT